MPEHNLPDTENSDAQADHELLRQAAEWFAELGHKPTAEIIADWQVWIQQSPRHHRAWQELERLAQRFEPLQHAIPSDAAAHALESMPNNATRINRRKLFNQSALLLGGLAMGWALLRSDRVARFRRNWLAEYQTDTGEVRQITLVDGSDIWLNTASSVDVEYSQQTRHINLLDGEIQIQTRYDSLRPFFVNTLHGQMQALGTRFTVWQQAEVTLLSVQDGAVLVSTKGTAKQLAIQAGEQLSFNENRLSSVAAADPARAAWKDQIIFAKNITLGRLVAEIQRYHHGYIYVAPEIESLKVMGTFPLHNVDIALAMIEQSLPVRMEHILGWWVTIKGL